MKKCIFVVCVVIVSAFLILASNNLQNPQWKGKIEYENGIKVVCNLRKEVFKSIKFVEDLSIGAEEGDENYMFPAPRDIDSDSQGNIYPDFRQYDLSIS